MAFEGFLLAGIGISIMMLTGNDGIIQKAGEAKIATERAEIEEILTMAYNDAKEQHHNIENQIY